LGGALFEKRGVRHLGDSRGGGDEGERGRDGAGASGRQGQVGELALELPGGRRAGLKLRIAAVLLGGPGPTGVLDDEREHGH
jgi:hypothetical protein